MQEQTPVAKLAALQGAFEAFKERRAIYESKLATIIEKSKDAGYPTLAHRNEWNAFLAEARGIQMDALIHLELAVKIDMLPEETQIEPVPGEDEVHGSVDAFRRCTLIQQHSQQVLAELEQAYTGGIAAAQAAVAEGNG